MRERVEEFVSALGATRSKETARAYRLSVGHYLAFCKISGIDSEKPPGDIFTKFVAYLSERRTAGNRPLSPNTIRLFVIGVARFFDWLRDGGLDMPKRPSFFALPRIPEKEPQVLTGEELVRYLEECYTLKHPVAAAMQIMPLTGLRISEVVRLTMDDWDVQRVDGEPQVFFSVRQGKGKKDRTVPMLLQGTALWKSYIREWRMGKHTDSNWLFPGQEINQPISVKTIRSALAKIRPYVTERFQATPHTMRRTYLSLLANHGASDLQMMEIAGHTSPRTTRRYTKFNTSRLGMTVRNIRIPEMDGRR